MRNLGLGALFRRFAKDRSGAVYIWVGGTILGILGLAGLAIDTGYLYVLRNKAQITADAAALAGVRTRAGPLSAPRNVAQQYAELNMPQVFNHGNDSGGNPDIVMGNWSNGSFTPGGAPENALSVTVRRTQANGNEAPTFFASVLGFNSVDIVTTAVAYHRQHQLLHRRHPRAWQHSVRPGTA